MSINLKTVILLLVLTAFLFSSGCSSSEENGIYYGQSPPGTTPEVFAPGIISNPEDMEYACTFSPDGSTIYYSVREGKTSMPKVYVSKLVEGIWQEPKEIEYSAEGILFEPHFLRDGSAMYFTGRIKDETDGIYRTGIWKMVLEDGEFSDLSYMCSGMYASASNSGKIYMTDIETGLGIVELIEREDSSFDYEALSGGVNEPVPGIHPCIAPDESFMIYDCNRADGYGGEGDLYVSFNNWNGTWSEGFNLGQEVNSEGVEFTASLSPDGKYIFFMKDYDLYWVDASIIEQFRP